MTTLMKSKMLTTSVLMLSLLGAAISPSMAQEYQRVYNAQAHRYEYVKKPTLGSKIKAGAKDAWHSPVIKKGAMGAGIGLGAAALSEKNLLKGGLVGAGVGAGMGAMDNSYYFNRHPLMRRASKGALVGAGAASVTGIAGMLPAAAVGAGVGAGVHYLKKY
jgi:hypothetical protein